MLSWVILKMINFKKNKKILIIGAGSGRDMASAILITEKYRSYNNHVDLAGFLTPWALHEFDGKLEKPINLLSDKPATKFIANNKNKKLSSFYEPELISLNKEFNLCIRNFYLFSLQYGIKRLKKEIEELINNNVYDLIIAVDVGGDILARKKDIESIFTPVVDFSCLEILSSINPSIEKQLVVIAPGVDGELSEKQLVDIFKEYSQQNFTFKSEAIRSRDRSYQKFINVFEEINKRTKSKSQTGLVIKKIVEKKIGLKSKIKYKKILRIKNKKWIIKFPVKLNLNIANKFFYFNLNDVKKFNNIVVNYNNIIEAFYQFKNLGFGGTELDLSYIPKNISNGIYKDYVFVLNIFNKVNNNEKKEIIKYALLKINNEKFCCGEINYIIHNP